MWFNAVRYGVVVVRYGMVKELVRSESGGCQELDPTLTIRAEQANPNLYSV